MTPLAFVIPLYIYPAPGAWEPLLAAAAAHPEVLFVCVVNPNSGPGSDALPDASYTAILTQLCELPNIQLLGYVHCQYAARNANLIKREIDIYAAWETASCGKFRIDGIFIDEAPWDPAHRGYMAALSHYIRQTWCATQPDSPTNRLNGAHRRKGIVVSNPGVVVEQGYLEDADLVVVFEQSHQHWCNYFMADGLCQIPPRLRHKAVAMIHSFGTSPAGAELNTTDDGEATALASQIRQLGFGGIYITEQLDGGYNHWPASWLPVASSVAEMNGTARHSTV